MNLKININKYILALSIVFCNLLSFAQSPDSLKLPFNLGKDDNAPSIDLKDPSNVETKVVYDPVTNQYKIVETIGDNEYRPSDNQDFDDFWENQNKQAEKEYWNQKKKENSGGSSDNGILDNVRIPGDAFESIFGSNKIEIKPQGSAELIFGVTSTKTENPIIRVQSQRVTSFDFDEKIQLNVTGKIGDKLQLGTSYNTEASFDFENQMKLQFGGKEDQIIKNIELGNVSMPLNSSLIQGSQSLFGIKTELQFGKLRVATVLSQQKSESKTIELSGGVQTKEVFIKADEYEDNRHFFLSQYFVDNYNSGLSNPPIINSAVNITKVEVWVTNVGISANTGARNVIGFMDLGERTTYDPTITPTLSQVYPDNLSNSLYPGLISNQDVRQYTAASGELIRTDGDYKYSAGLHFNKIENARKLNAAEYFIHPQLGYISLNRKMEDDEVLAIAFQYTVRGSDDVFQVGEFSDEVPDVQSSIYLKLLKSTQVNNVNIPLWDLMMKNVYSLGTYGVDASTLEIDIRYRDPSTNNDINYFNASTANINVKNKRWLEILDLDRLDQMQNLQPDGKYDIIDGQTIRIQNGKIYFPVLQPFGKKLREEINDNALADQYAFDSLYHVSKFRAKNEFPTNNRFQIYAQYSSKSSVINLNSFSIPKGAVTVTAGGRKLTEGADFRVDYNMGQVTILDQSILNSNTPIRVNVESNSMFSIMSKTLFGTHLDYEINKDFHVGATFMNLTERPLTQKVNQGEEPIKNTMWGVNSDYKTESEYLTKLVDKIPFINTKAKSSIEVKGEFAQLIPGSPNAIENGGEAVSFIDDFEAGQTGIDIRNRIAWTLASTPQENTEWPEGDSIDNVVYGFNRAKFAWYNIDPIFGDDNGANT
ncbi:cell surface protein SprA, partial [Flavobacteriales bacterium]|nr:cell surface protein SprA [Flavobacteriales bacterium]